MIGMSILRAIVAGERDGEKTGITCRSRWPPATCDLQAMMKQMPSAEMEPTPPSANQTSQPKRRRKKNGRSSKNEPNFDLAGELKRVTGVDLTRIEGIKANTVQTVISEAGLDLSKRPTEDHFVSWIGFAPRNDISGGKVLKKQTRKVVSRLATALRMAASTRRENKSYLGAQFRRLRVKLGPPHAQVRPRISR
jgi:hypothetical protein